MPSESILKDALTAYLQPLLKKHEANTLVEFEDLTASWKAADAVLKRSSAADDAVVSVIHQAFLAGFIALLIPTCIEAGVRLAQVTVAGLSESSQRSTFLVGDQRFCPTDTTGERSRRYLQLPLCRSCNGAAPSLEGTGNCFGELSY
jgi:hypothetical protein